MKGERNGKRRELGVGRRLLDMVRTGKECSVLVRVQEGGYLHRLWAVKYPCPVEPGAMLSECVRVRCGFGFGFGGRREDGRWKAGVGRDENVRKWEGLGGLMGVSVH